MDIETRTGAPAAELPTQRRPDPAEAEVAPLAGCQCRSCQGARFL